MTHLQGELLKILGSFDTRKPVLYIDYPVHLNVGDLLINAGTEKLLKENGVKVWRRYSIFDMPNPLPSIDPSITILCHGGGNFGDLWSEHHQLREAIFERYPGNRIVVLPQTVHFSSQHLALASAARLQRHSNHQIFVRDEESLGILQSAGMTQIAMMPDMAHAMWGAIQPTAAATLGTLYLYRRDKEAPQRSAQDGTEPVLPAGACDWWTIVSHRNRRLAEMSKALLIREAAAGLTFQKHRQWYPVRDRAIQDGVDLFSQYDTIDTNRLHAMILGTLLQRSLVVHDNSYGKLSSYFRAWLSDSPNISFEELDASH